jgi:hypothetical protein
VIPWKVIRVLQIHADTYTHTIKKTNMHANAAKSTRKNLLFGTNLGKCTDTQANVHKYTQIHANTQIDNNTRNYTRISTQKSANPCKYSQLITNVHKCTQMSANVHKYTQIHTSMQTKTPSSPGPRSSAAQYTIRPMKKQWFRSQPRRARFLRQPTHTNRQKPPDSPYVSS